MPNYDEIDNNEIRDIIKKPKEMKYKMMKKKKQMNNRLSTKIANNSNATKTKSYSKLK